MKCAWYIICNFFPLLSAIIHEHLPCIAIPVIFFSHFLQMENKGKIMRLDKFVTQFCKMQI